MLEARKITVKYGAREAVSEVSLRAEPGQLLAIIGPNGAGKSTLLRVLNHSIEATQWRRAAGRSAASVLCAPRDRAPDCRGRPGSGPAVSRSP